MAQALSDRISIDDLPPEILESIARWTIPTASIVHFRGALDPPEDNKYVYAFAAVNKRFESIFYHLIAREILFMTVTFTSCLDPASTMCFEDPSPDIKLALENRFRLLHFLRMQESGEPVALTHLGSVSTCAVAMFRREKAPK
ncbi:hypothetical protein PMZ80_000856 [Knufia obscura]|uniref:Uncharacterized protein n=2 Tax=Knufia TaxID=430999 RepID=A0AAN8I4F9_9EURO|nr:hypothetical protein PMZ80_000856 [Knufia obscura]KAK5949880.1 hypothetical protein OHC33_009065 [Knufia fluminis]